jgi:hypothetical protein
VSGSNPKQYYKNVSWTPTLTNARLGPYIICATIGDTTCLYSPNYCITLFVGASAPYLVSNSLVLEITNGINLTWSISFNTKVQKPTTSAYIRYFNINDTEVLSIDTSNSSLITYNNQTTYTSLKWTTLNNFADGSYYIKFDRGIGIGTQYCLLKSIEVIDKSFFTFSVIASVVTITSSITSTLSSSTLQTVSVTKNTISKNKNYYTLKRFSFVLKPQSNSNILIIAIVVSILIIIIIIFIILVCVKVIKCAKCLCRKKSIKKPGKIIK